MQTQPDWTQPLQAQSAAPILLSRRAFLTSGAVAAYGWSRLGQTELDETFHPADPPAFSVVPVVGDGKWIWRDPPEEARGFLEPHPYSLTIGIELEGTGAATDLKATTVAPVEHPEQKIDDAQIETEGCTAQLRPLTPAAGQLLLSAPAIDRGQTITARAHYKLTLFKQYHAFEREQFPAQQKPPAEIRKTFLQDSPGIQTRIKPVRDLAAALAADLRSPAHPWDLARVFAEWPMQHIRPQLGPYTSVAVALENRRGDCEEMAGVFVALCRAQGIPARLVWTPNHAWGEFYLVDEEGTGRWIPAHTACYSWFGWTGAHELVLQKGDRIVLPERRKQVRLLADWLQQSGPAPRVRFTAELTPQPVVTGGDAGPGARRKDERGEWKVVGGHPLDSYIRQ